MSKASATRKRISHAERRETAREALLDATLESLVDVGYDATTTRGVAEKAGVTQGAQQHYFPSKATLVDAAMLRLMQKLLSSAATMLIHGDSEREQAAALVDRLWDIHTMPLGRVVFELMAKARTDTDMARRVAPIQVQAIQSVQQIARTLLPGLAAVPGFDDWLLVTLSTLRGTALIAVIPGAEKGVASWPSVRRQVLRSLDAVIEDAKATPVTKARFRSGRRP